MADQDGHNSDIKTQLLRHVTSLTHDTVVKEDIFRPAIHPPSIAVMAFIFSELRRGWGNPPPSPSAVVEDQKCAI